MTSLIVGLLNIAKALINTQIRRLGVDGGIILEWALIKWGRRA
jgi:hypothetical protein